MDLRGPEAGIESGTRESRLPGRESVIPLAILIPVLNPSNPGKFPIPNP